MIDNNSEFIKKINNIYESSNNQGNQVINRIRSTLNSDFKNIIISESGIIIKIFDIEIYIKIFFNLQILENLKDKDNKENQIKIEFGYIKSEIDEKGKEYYKNIVCEEYFFTYPKMTFFNIKDKNESSKIFESDFLSFDSLLNIIIEIFLKAIKDIKFIPINYKDNFKEK